MAPSKELLEAAELLKVSLDASRQQIEQALEKYVGTFHPKDVGEENVASHIEGVMEAFHTLLRNANG